MWALRELLHGRVSIPEIYGWCRDGGENFVYMELVEGETLEQRWPALSMAERLEVSRQLRDMMESLASLKQKNGINFIGGLCGEPLQNNIFAIYEKKGPFSSVKEFHDWYSDLPKCGFVLPENFVDPYRHELPGDVSIKFTHNDLHPSNIIISSNSDVNLKVSIIDWHQSGWYPEYWEGCKFRWGVSGNSEWTKTYIPEFLEEPICYEAWFYYLDAIGC